MGVITSYVGNIIWKITMVKKTKKKSTTKKVPKDFFKIAFGVLSEPTRLDDSFGKGVVKGNTVGRVQDYLNQSGGNKDNE
tara:strand:- start:2877 stop:3116 length:240 start_codon:yes stop_codon:yes gene_type:complete